MSFYDFLSVILTIIGTTVLVYRTVQQLQNTKKTTTLQKLSTKWIISLLFLKLEYILLAIIEIVPLGALALLVVKFFLFMPQNPISHRIYKYIRRKLQKIKIDQYHGAAYQYISKLYKILIVSLLQFIEKTSIYVNAQDIQAVQNGIIDIIKVLQYKKASVNMRLSTYKSAMNDCLNQSSLNTSSSQQQIIANLNDLKDMNFDIKQDSTILNSLLKQGQKKNSKIAKSQTAQRMSILLKKQTDQKQNISIKAQLLITKPNKIKGTPAVYQKTTILFNKQTKKITFSNINKAVQTGTLKQIKWVTKNMMIIQMMLQQGRSKVIKLTQKSDVASWLMPICQILNAK